jgi:hypothetical protein
MMYGAYKVKWMHLKQIFVIYLINLFSYFKQIRKFITGTTKTAVMLLLVHDNSHLDT